MQGRWLGDWQGAWLGTASEPVFADGLGLLQGLSTVAGQPKASASGAFTVGGSASLVGVPTVLVGSALRVQAQGFLGARLVGSARAGARFQGRGSVAANPTASGAAPFEVRVSAVAFDSRAAPFEVRVSAVAFDSRAAPFEVRVSWLEFETAATPNDFYPSPLPALAARRLRRLRLFRDEEELLLAAA